MKKMHKKTTSRLKQRGHNNYISIAKAEIKLS